MEDSDSRGCVLIWTDGEFRQFWGCVLMRRDGEFRQSWGCVLMRRDGEFRQSRMCIDEEGWRIWIVKGNVD